MSETTNTDLLVILTDVVQQVGRVDEKMSALVKSHETLKEDLKPFKLDVETRLRSLERWRNYATGIATAISSALTFLVTKIIIHR